METSGHPLIILSRCKKKKKKKNLTDQLLRFEDFGPRIQNNVY